MKKIIDFNNVDITYSNNIILKNITFSINQGDFAFLTGKIGSGKTSFLKTIYAEKEIKKGDAKVFEYQINNIKRKQIPFLRRKIGFIFQDFKFLNNKNVYNNLKFILHATGWTNEKLINERIENVISEVGLSNKLNANIFELSGGELQRIALARALLNSPKLFLADEPTGNLDHESAVYVTKKLAEQTKKNCAVIFVTHNNNLLNIIPEAHKFSIKNKNINSND